MACAYDLNCAWKNSDDCSDTCVRYTKLNYLFDVSYIPKNWLKPIILYIDSDLCDKESFEYLKQVQSNIEDAVAQGLNLYLYSNTPGNGKTSWTIKLAKTYLYKIWFKCDLATKVLYINVPSYLLELKANISEKSDYIAHINKNVSSCDLVIWDDIGTKSATEFEHEHLLSMIDNRLYNNKSNIFTSNIMPNELDDLIGSRLASRIINESRLVEFKGKDKRGLSWKIHSGV